MLQMIMSASASTASGADGFIATTPDSIMVFSKSLDKSPLLLHSSNANYTNGANVANL